MVAGVEKCAAHMVETNRDGWGVKSESGTMGFGVAWERDWAALGPFQKGPKAAPPLPHAPRRHIRPLSLFIPLSPPAQPDTSISPAFGYSFMYSSARDTLQFPVSEIRNSSSGNVFSGFGSMFKSVQIWSNLVQINAFVKVKSVDIPKTIRIFVQLQIRVRA